MTAAVRKVPDSTNGTPPYDGLAWQRLVNNEVIALWKTVPSRLTSAAGTNDITAASDTALVAVITAYAQPMSFWLTPANTNTGGVTINIDSVGVVNLKDNAGVALIGGALVAGSLYLIQYDGTGFRVVAAGTSSGAANTAPDLILRDEKTTGTAAGGFTSGSFTARTLNTAVRNVLAGASLSANQFTLQAGTYLIEWSAPASQVGLHQTRLFNATDSATVETGTSAMANTGAQYAQDCSFGKAVVTITSAKVFEIDHICTTTKATDGLGIATSLAAKEVFAWVNVWKVGSLPSAVNGVAGGAVTFPVLFSTTTADADPGAGTLRLNNATQNAATRMYIDLSDANLTDITAVLDSLANAGDVSSRGQIRLVKYDDPTDWIDFNFTAWTTASGYRKLTIAIIGQSAASPFANGDRLYFAYSRTGNNGGQGAVSIPYTFSTTTTDSDPGAGVLRLDNATQESAVTIRTDLLDNLGADWTSVLDTLDASTSTIKGQVRLSKLYDSTKYLTFDLTARAAPSGYRNFTVANTGKSGTNPFANGDALVLAFTRNGDKGNTGATGSIGTLNANTAGFTMINGTIVESHAANAVTFAIKGQNGSDPAVGNEVYIVFRDVAAGTGGYTLITLTAATSITVPSTATLGAANATAFRIWLVGFNDAGTFRLGVINCLSGTSIYPLGQFPIASSTLTPASAAQVFYTTGAAVTSKAYAVLGYIGYESGLTTAGTWAAAPTRIQLYGHGQKLPGDEIQRQRTDTGAVATGTTIIPVDDTIPQNTEGDQYMSLAITPTSACNLLEVEASGAVTQSAGAFGSSALFRDTTANAVAAITGPSNSAAASKYDLDYAVLAGSVAATTFKYRSGGAVAGTTTFNGGASARTFAGVCNSFMKIRELMA